MVQLYNLLTAAWNTKHVLYCVTDGTRKGNCTGESKNVIWEYELPNMSQCFIVPVSVYIHKSEECDFIYYLSTDSKLWQLHCYCCNEIHNFFDTTKLLIFPYFVYVFNMNLKINTVFSPKRHTLSYFYWKHNKISGS